MDCNNTELWQQYKHLRHAVAIQLITIDRRIKGYQAYKTNLESFLEQLDKVINKPNEHTTGGDTSYQHERNHQPKRKQ